jgi:hypothetical protein
MFKSHTVHINAQHVHALLRVNMIFIAISVHTQESNLMSVQGVKQPLLGLTRDRDTGAWIFNVQPKADWLLPCSLDQLLTKPPRHQLDNCPNIHLFSYQIHLWIKRKSQSPAKAQPF